MVNPTVRVKYRKYQFFYILFYCIGMFSLADGEMFEGDIPTKEQKLIKSFVLKYGEELLKMWETQNFSTLEPLE